MKKGLSQLKELYKEKYYWSQPYLCRLLLDFKFDFEKVNNQINNNDSEKTITVGTDSFREIFLRKSYFVDKTMLISYLLSAQKAKAFAFIYFRRTGKTTNLSTLQEFFDTNYNCLDLFSNTKIAQHTKIMNEHYKQHPVVFLDFKSISSQNFKQWFFAFQQIIVQEYLRYKFVLKSLNESDSKQFNLIINFDETAYWPSSIKQLQQFINTYYNNRYLLPVLIIDEYDVPINNSINFTQQEQDDACTFYKSFLIVSLKGNENQYKAIISGCTNVCLKGIISELNNLQIDSIHNSNCGEYFGLQENEVNQMLEHTLKNHNIQPEEKQQVIKDKMILIKRWYNGYWFGKYTIFNTYNIVSYLADLYSQLDSFPKSYWTATGSGQSFQKLILSENFDDEDQKIMFKLMLLVESKEEQEITIDLATDNLILAPRTQQNILSLLFFSGYLTINQNQGFAIPNREIREELKILLKNYISSRMQPEQSLFTHVNQITSAVRSFETMSIQMSINSLFSKAPITFYNSLENRSHIFFALIFTLNNSYNATCETPDGRGRSDIILTPRNVHDFPVVVELKQIKCALKCNNDTPNTKKEESKISTVLDDALIQAAGYRQAVNVLNQQVEVKRINCIAIVLYRNHFYVKTQESNLLPQKEIV
ncbi:Conserved_hypothetical protein [Hexamita inflata]|uniref:AAA-ATPase-like domain-containing protein n=1 Tax=Hexamita inflata TaxID=28002 RepID=A0AA86U683_9EUKA|nr:Conserved hypothetical protein [Hexamita inflata]